MPPTTPTPPVDTPLKRQTIKAPKKKLKEGRRAKLVRRTRQGSKLKWTSKRKRVCKVAKYRVKGIREGKCILRARASAVPGYRKYTKRHTIRVR